MNVAAKEVNADLNLLCSDEFRLDHFSKQACNPKFPPAKVSGRRKREKSKYYSLQEEERFCREGLFFD